MYKNKNLDVIKCANSIILDYNKDSGNKNLDIKNSIYDIYLKMCDAYNIKAQANIRNVEKELFIYFFNVLCKKKKIEDIFLYIILNFELDKSATVDKYISPIVHCKVKQFKFMINNDNRNDIIYTKNKTDDKLLTKLLYSIFSSIYNHPYPHINDNEGSFYEINLSKSIAVSINYTKNYIRINNIDYTTGQIFKTKGKSLKNIL